MHKLTTLLAALILAGLTGPLGAQDTPAEAPATDTPVAETPAQPATDTQLDTGQIIAEDGTSAEPTVGQPYVRESFGDWQQRCLRAEEGPDPCQLYQLLANAEGNPIAEVSIVPLPPGGQAVAGVVIVVPLETQLTEQLRLGIDGAQARVYPFDFCNRAGCVARFGLVEEQLAQFKRGVEGRVTIVPAAQPDEQIVLTMSLTGFTAAFDASAVEAP